MSIIKHIPKIAFFVSAAALIFSIATLIRTIVMHQTNFIWLSILQVVGTTLIMGICAIVIVISKNRNYDDYDEDEDGEYEETGKNYRYKKRSYRSAQTKRAETLNKTAENIEESDTEDENIYDLPEVEDRDMDETGLIDKDL